jgi:hypothetical protein
VGLLRPVQSSMFQSTTIDILSVRSESHKPTLFRKGPQTHSTRPVRHAESIVMLIFSYLQQKTYDLRARGNAKRCPAARLLSGFGVPSDRTTLQSHHRVAMKQ